MPTPRAGCIRIVLIDDHELVRAGLRILLECHRGMTVVGEAANSAAALAVVTREQPDIILLDLDLNGESGLDILPKLLHLALGARVIVVTGVRSPDMYLRATQLGAMGLVRKDEAVEVLAQAIDTVHAGEAWLEPSIVARMISQMSSQRAVGEAPTNPEAAKVARLTAREREVIALIGEGRHNKQIAKRLSISETTVSHHLTSIFGKIGVTNRFDLVVYAYRHGLVELPR